MPILDAVSEETLKALNANISAERLWKRHMELAEVGARPDGGVNRAALSAADVEARRLLIRWCEESGYQCHIDGIGNIFARREGDNPSLPPILTGSHLDSQPAGGRFDGAFGVLAGLEAMQALDAVGLASERPIELVSWTNEEGSRFAPGTMGSSVFTGQLQMDDLARTTDAAGVCLADELSKLQSVLGSVPHRPIGFPVAAYIEPHIEQGPVLEQEGASIGVVTGIQGVRWFSVEVLGAEAHAGTTPHRMRRDAVQVMATIVSELKRLLSDDADLMRFTVGRILVEPNSPNTIPAKVTFTVDLRHPDARRLDISANRIMEVCEALKGHCSVSVIPTLSMPPIAFPDSIVDMVDLAASAFEVKSMRLTSGAFHDAKWLADVCPSGMIFIPCANGISHSPKESAQAKDIASGAKVLAVCLAQLASKNGIQKSPNADFFARSASGGKP